MCMLQHVEKHTLHKNVHAAACCKTYLAIAFKNTHATCHKKLIDTPSLIKIKF